MKNEDVKSKFGRWMLAGGVVVVLGFLLMWMCVGKFFKTAPEDADDMPVDTGYRFRQRRSTASRSRRPA